MSRQTFHLLLIKSLAHLLKLIFSHPFSHTHHHQVGYQTFIPTYTDTQFLLSLYTSKPPCFLHVSASSAIIYSHYHLPILTFYTVYQLVVSYYHINICYYYYTSTEIRNTIHPTFLRIRPSLRNSAHYSLQLETLLFGRKMKLLTVVVSSTTLPPERINVAYVHKD